MSAFAKEEASDMNQLDQPIALPPTDTAFVQFWNEVLAPKFIRFKHVLVGGLSKHSEAIFPTLPSTSRGSCA